MKIFKPNKSINTNKAGNVSSYADLYYRWIRVIFTLFVVFIFSNCASISFNKDTVAIVDDELVTRKDVEYSLQIEHRREDLSSANKINISAYIKKIIDEKLIIQEAKRMGMDNSPALKRKVQDFLVRESVVRLYNEEIIQKVSVTEEEIQEKYKKDYELFNFLVIEVDSVEDAEKAHEKLREGNEFGKLAGEYSTHSSSKDGGEVTIARKDLGFLEKPAIELGFGELSDVIKGGHKFYIIKVLGREDADETIAGNIHDGLKGRINARKIKERSAEYLKQLRDEAGLKIDRDLLAAIDQEVWDKDRKEWLVDERPLAEMKDTVLTAGEFVAKLPAKKSKLIEMHLDNWINLKAVDIGALKKRYDVNTDLKDTLDRYKSKLIIKAFNGQVLMPMIKMSEKNLDDYYAEHKDDFAKPTFYRIQQLTVKTKDEADNILKSLKDGANFTWMANEKSVDSYSQSGGAIGWVQKENLSESIRDTIDTYQLGDVSPVFEIDMMYRIIRLIAKTDAEYETLDQVKSLVRKKVFQKKYDDLYKEYVDELRMKADIRMNNSAVQSFENMFGK